MLCCSQTEASGFSSLCLRVCPTDSKPVDFCERSHQSLWFQEPDPEIRSQVCGLQVSLHQMWFTIRVDMTTVDLPSVSLQSARCPRVSARSTGRAAFWGESSDGPPSGVHRGLRPPLVSQQTSHLSPLWPNESLITSRVTETSHCKNTKCFCSQGRWKGQTDVEYVLGERGQQSSR